VTEPLRMAFEVGCSAEHAFATWTERLDRWWPVDHTVSGETGLAIVVERRPGGKIFERTVAGIVHEWGEVTEWDPPRHIGYRWYLRQDRADATHVDISFIDRGESTLVEIVHTGWERLGAKGPDRRAGNQAGWAGVLPHYIEACQEES
jgi:uncharacterized protein YndB with AHSA1/START domain